jgi:predicted metal-dependent phosphoesterase TrpH
MPHRLRRADLHAHSSRSGDVAGLPSLSPRALFERTLGHPDPRQRMDWFVLTDHDTMAGWEDLERTLPEADRRLLIPAVEHTLCDPTIGFSIHVNLYLLDPDRHAELRRRVRTLDDLLDFCAAHRILAQYNHPTWFEKDEFAAGRVNLAKVPAIADRFDVLEMNGGRSAALNWVTWELAREKAKAVTASSDSHTGDIGAAWTAAAGDTPAEWLGNVWAGRSAHHCFDMTFNDLVSAAQSIIDLLLQPGHEGCVSREAMAAGSPRIERAAARMLGSSFVRRHASTRTTLRFLLRGLARPVIHRHLEHERRLERAIIASELAVLHRRVLAA